MLGFASNSVSVNLLKSPSVFSASGPLHSDGVSSTGASGQAAPPIEIVPQVSHLEEVNSVALSADGRWVLSDSNDNTLKLWDATTPCAPRGLDREHPTDYVGPLAALDM
jgi:WD40 repeat protein